MAIHEASFFRMYFGDMSDELCSHEDLNLDQKIHLVMHPRFSFLQEALQLDTLFFLRQTHSTNGIALQTVHEIPPSFMQEGDFIVTHLPRIGIGVITADCLPVIAIDTAHKAIGIAHAGWKGALAGISLIMMRHMYEYYGTQPYDVRIFLGPSAQSCCYQVDAPFERQLLCGSRDVIIRRDGYCYFDLPLYVSKQLQTHGIMPSNIDHIYNSCTICNDRFCSYRRQAHHAGRQMTVIVIR